MIRRAAQDAVLEMGSSGIRRIASATEDLSSQFSLPPTGNMLSRAIAMDPASSRQVFGAVPRPRPTANIGSRPAPTVLGRSGVPSSVSGISAGRAGPDVSGIKIVAGKSKQGRLVANYNVGAGTGNNTPFALPAETPLSTGPKPGAPMMGPNRPLQMPQPRRMHGPVGRPSGGGSMGGSMNWMSAIGETGLSVGLGAAAGGATSYMSGGNFGQGALAGGLIAGGGYAGALGLGQRGVGGYAPKIANLMSDQASSVGRRAAFAAGGMLGGGMFGGNKSHRRGFNANRGNSIGR